MQRRRVYRLKWHKVWWRLLFSKERSSFCGRLIRPNVDARSVRHSGLVLKQTRVVWRQWILIPGVTHVCGEKWEVCAGLAQHSAVLLCFFRTCFWTGRRRSLIGRPPLLKITTLYRSFPRGSTQPFLKRTPAWLVFAGVAAWLWYTTNPPPPQRLSEGTQYKANLFLYLFLNQDRFPCSFSPKTSQL